MKRLIDISQIAPHENIFYRFGINQLAMPGDPIIWHWISEFIAEEVINNQQTKNLFLEHRMFTDSGFKIFESLSIEEKEIYLEYVNKKNSFDIQPMILNLGHYSKYDEKLKRFADTIKAITVLNLEDKFWDFLFSMGVRYTSKKRLPSTPGSSGSFLDFEIDSHRHMRNYYRDSLKKSLGNCN